MTVRNVSIVFSPTLGVPAGLFTLLLAEYSTIFSWAHNDKARGTEAESTAPVVAATENAISTIVEEQESKGLAKVPAHVPVIDVRNSESHSHQLHRPVTPVLEPAVSYEWYYCRDIVDRHVSGESC